MKSMRRWALMAALCACGGEDGRDVVKVPIVDECNGLSDRVLCSSGSALTCVSGNVAARDACINRGLTCADGHGCRACEPMTTSCAGNQRSRCNADGSALTLVETCSEQTFCAPTGCLDLCADAASNRSYLGCDYWPVFTSNSNLFKEFSPAVAIGNGNLVPAHVVISQNGTVIRTLDVPANSANTINLAFVDALKNPGGSRLVRGGAYHLVSSVPVTVHQFNPLLYELPQDCADEAPPGSKTLAIKGDNKCNSFTNDASLLLPSTALAPDTASNATEVSFVAMARASFETLNADNTYRGTPGFVAITAVGNAPVHVKVQSTAFTQASPVSSLDVVPALSPGDMLERDLNPGDVLQLTSQVLPTCSGPVAETRNAPVCDPGPTYDLTGTRIVADGAIQVISGHDCAYVPFDRVACDHLEESMTPVSTWGTAAVVTVPRSSAGAEYVMRIFSDADNNQITFDPAVNAPVTLNRGQMLELDLRQAVYVKGTGRLMIGQYLVGQGASQLVGDPSLTVAVTTDQFREHYNFLSPSTYQQNVVDVIALATDVVTIDGKVVTGFTQVGASRFRVASIALDTSGAHEAHGTSDFGFGIVVYGLGAYTSYMLPGGLDLAPLLIGF